LVGSRVERKTDGLSFRVPVADVSSVDLTASWQPASYEQIKAAMKEASEVSLRNSWIYRKMTLYLRIFWAMRAHAFDAKAGIALNDSFVKGRCMV